MRKQVMFGVLAVVLLFGVVGLASAGTATFNGVPNAGGSLEASNTPNPVLVKASVNPKIALTVAAPAGALATDCWVDFGPVDPGPHAGGMVSLTVSSNKQFDMASVQNDTTFGSVGGLITLNRTKGGIDADWADVPKGSAQVLTDTYGIVVPWTTDPGNYTATVQYTVTQD